MNESQTGVLGPTPEKTKRHKKILNSEIKLMI